MNKLPKEKRDRLVMTIVLSAFTTLAIYVFIVSPQREEIRVGEEKLAASLDLRDTSLRWMRMAPTVRSNLLARRITLAEEEASMAPLDKFNWFYNTLEGFRSRYNVQLVDITREPEISSVSMLPKFPYEGAIFGVKLHATYHDFGRFLAELENQFPQMRVQHLRIDMDPTLRLMETNTSAASDFAERLAISLNVVTMIKPSASL